ncbi:hypothetical protein [Variovorax sp. dw_308]|uniref:hypothetical protein n=1 Tax=Variovorax sp. dw_308 TaxID=2721546 RepID=UPI001C47C6C7|nr:hypothetical protein [Variovorax sp. dw_308]
MARDGQQALAELAAFKPHVVILDIGLPVLECYELRGASGCWPRAEASCSSR